MAHQVTFHAVVMHVLRRMRFLWWATVIRVWGRLGFKSIGRGVKFNGWIRFEKPCSDIVIGDDCLVGKGCYFLATPDGKIGFGNRVLINDYCYITSNYGIAIGNDVQIAEFVSIRDYDHEFSRTDIPISRQGLRGGPISIGEGTWIGRGVMITSGVTIGENCVIGANSVVTRDIPAWSVAAGAPARILRSRRDEQFST